MKKHPLKNALFHIGILFLLSHLPACASDLDEIYESERFTLPNGLTVVLKERPQTKSVYFILGVKVGSRYESLAQRGLAHSTEHMMFHGTETRSQEELTREIHDRGGDKWAETSTDTTWFYLDLPADEAAFGTEWLSDIIGHSTFTERRIEIAKQVLLREIGQRGFRDHWGRFLKGIYGDSSLSRSYQYTLLEKWLIKYSFDRDSLMRFYKEQYVPNNMVLTVVGNFQESAMKAQIANSCGRMPKGEIPPGGSRSNLTLPTRPIRFAVSTYSSNADVIYGFALPKRKSGDRRTITYFFRDAIIQIQDRLREEGLSYGPTFTRVEYSDGGLVYLYADCRPKDIIRVEKVVQEEWSKILDAPLSDAVVKTIKQRIIQDFDSDLSNEDVALHLARAAIVNEQPLKIGSYLDKLSPSVFEAVKTKYLQPERQFTAFYRPYLTQNERIVVIVFGLSILVFLQVLSLRVRTHVEKTVIKKEKILYNPIKLNISSVFVSLLRLIVQIPLGLIIAYLLILLLEYFFRHVMFVAAFLFFLVFAVLSPPSCFAGLSCFIRGVGINDKGIVVDTLGFPLVLKAGNIKSVESVAVSSFRRLHPLYLFGGRYSRAYLRIRAKYGITVCCSVRDPEALAQEINEYLDSKRNTQSHPK